MRSLIAGFVIGIFSAVSVNAATIVSFVSVPTAGTVPADIPTGPGVTGYDLGRSTGLIPYLGNSSTYNSYNWLVGGDKLGALVDKDSLYWGSTSTGGYDLTTLEIAYDRSPTGPKSISIDLFIRDVLTNALTFQGEVFSDDNFSQYSSAKATIDLTAFDNVQNAFFRLSGWNATGTSGTFDPENRLAGDKAIIVSGELTPVPLPAGLPLLLAGMGVLSLLHRRRR